jgi:hypothetical protein
MAASRSPFGQSPLRSWPFAIPNQNTGAKGFSLIIKLTRKKNIFLFQQVINTIDGKTFIFDDWSNKYHVRGHLSRKKTIFKKKIF